MEEKPSFAAMQLRRAPAGMRRFENAATMARRASATSMQNGEASDSRGGPCQPAPITTRAQCAARGAGLRLDVSGGQAHLTIGKDELLVVDVHNTDCSIVARSLHVLRLPVDAQAVRIRLNDGGTGIGEWVAATQRSSRVRSGDAGRGAAPRLRTPARCGAFFWPPPPLTAGEIQ